MAGKRSRRKPGGGAHSRQTAEAASATRAVLNLAESPLHWLRRRKNKNGEPMLTDAQFAAGERLRVDFELGHMAPRVTTNWEERAAARPSPRITAFGALELSERVSAARERVRRALAAVGPELAGILIDVCCHLKRLEDAEEAWAWPQRSAKVVFQLALTALARHYGLLAPSGRPDQSGAWPRHWGAPDYRPTIAS